MVTKRMETVEPGPLSGGFGGGPGFKPMGKPGFRTPRMVDFLPPAKMAPPTPAGNVPAFRGTGGYSNLSRMVPSGAPGGPARVPNTGTISGTPSTMGSWGANMARGALAAARAALTGIQLDALMDDAFLDEQFWEGWADDWSEYWASAGAPDPNPANWTFPGYTYNCTAPYGCAPPQPTEWEFWTNQGLPVFGCVPAIYTCNNFGDGFTETELRALPLGNYSDVWVGNNRGPFSQSLQHGWLRDAPVLTKLEPDLKRRAIPLVNGPELAIRTGPLAVPRFIPMPGTAGSPGTSGGAGSSGEWGPLPPKLPKVTSHRSTDDFPDNVNKPIPYHPPYEEPAPQVTVYPQPGGPGLVVGPPTVGVHENVPNDDHKIEFPEWLFNIVKNYHRATEVNDFFEALADAIPDGRCSNMPGFQRANCVLRNWNKIDPVQAVKNLIANEFEDQVVARATGLLGSTSGGQYGGPSTTQMTTFLKTMRSF